jgi:putative transposase
MTMPRAPRLDLPDVPLHVTQRGVNRCAIFMDDEDRHYFRYLLRNACRAHGVSVHAFVLMDNHLHLLLASPECGAVTRVMRAAGQVYVQAFNTRHRRSGTLFQGRFKSCLVESGRYLLNVIRYIELNPVRAAMVATPEAWRWSSVHTHARAARDSLVTPHPLYLALGNTPPERAQAYRRWLDAGTGADELATIRRSLQQERALGDAGFRSMVERTLNRSADCRPCGRPRADERMRDGV